MIERGLRGPNQRFDREEMWKLIREGMGDTAIARILGVTRKTIFYARQKVKAAVVKTSVMESAHRIVEKELNVAQQLFESNKRIGEVAEDLMQKLKGNKTGTPDISGNKDIRTILKEFEEERRKQLAFQVEIFKVLADYKVVAEFQAQVLDTIGNASVCPYCGVKVICPKCEREIDLRAIALAKLKEAKALRTAVALTK